MRWGEHLFRNRNSVFYTCFFSVTPFEDVDIEKGTYCLSSS
jgi:hypothetical protein